MLLFMYEPNRCHDVFYGTRRPNACRSFIDVDDEEATANIHLSKRLKSGGIMTTGAKSHFNNSALSSSDDEGGLCDLPDPGGEPWEYGQVAEETSEWIKKCVNDPSQWTEFQNIKSARDSYRWAWRGKIDKFIQSSPSATVYGPTSQEYGGDEGLLRPHRSLGHNMAALPSGSGGYQ